MELRRVTTAVAAYLDLPRKADFKAVNLGWLRMRCFQMKELETVLQIGHLQVLQMEVDLLQVVTKQSIQI